MDGNLKLECVNNAHVPNWTLTRLKLKNSLEVRQIMYNSDDEIEVRTGGEWITNSLAHGDNVVVPTDTTNPF
jgi:hypothetical protein